MISPWSQRIACFTPFWIDMLMRYQSKVTDSINQCEKERDGFIRWVEKGNGGGLMLLLIRIFGSRLPATENKQKKQKMSHS